MAEDNKLNLPVLHKKSNLASRKEVKKINTIDLSKKASVDKIVNAESKSIKEELLKKNSGLDLILVGDLTGSMGHITAY